MRLPAILRRAAAAQRRDDAPALSSLTKPNQSVEAAYEAAMNAAEARYEAEVAEIDRRFEAARG